MRDRTPYLGPLSLLVALIFACAKPPTPPSPPVQDGPVELSEIKQRVVLVGDAGADSAESLLATVAATVAQVPARSTVVFLGDNFYPSGPAKLADPARSRIMQRQLDAGAQAAGTIFIIGNHEWDDSGFQHADTELGLSRAMELEDYIQSNGNGRQLWLPKAGCPGPEVIDRDPVRMIVVDSAWWLLKREERSVIAQQRGCATTSEAQVLEQIEAALVCSEDERPCRHRIVLSHHPIQSYGPHGGYFPLRDHLFCGSSIPLPIGCSVGIVARLLGVARQDLASSRYRAYAEAMWEVAQSAPPLAFAGGHEHSLQVIDPGAPPLLLVSGSAAKQSPVSDAPEFGASRPGFMTLDFMRGGAVLLRVFEEAGGHRAVEVFRREILPTGS